MILIPSITVRAGHVVSTGATGGGGAADVEVTPVRAAKALRQQGAIVVHVEDADAAAGEGDNLAIATALQEAMVTFQWSGGIATAAQADAALAAGADRVVLAPAALGDAAELVQRLRARVIAAIDVPSGAGVDALPLAVVRSSGVQDLVLRRVDAEGVVLPPDVELLRAVLAAVEGVRVHAHASVDSRSQLEVLEPLTELGFAGVILAAGSGVLLAAAQG